MDELPFSKKKQIKKPKKKQQSEPTRKEEQKAEKQVQHGLDTEVYKMVEQRSYSWELDYNVCEYCKKAPACHMHHDPPRLVCPTSFETVFHICLDCHIKYHQGSFTSEQLESFRNRP